MSNIKDWSTVPGDNSSAPPLGAPENATFIADGNDIDRQLMADVRDECEDQGWFNRGDTATNTGTNSFTITGNPLDDVGNPVYYVGRKVRILDTGAYIYGEITASDYINPNTQITIDATGLTASMNGQTVSTGVPGEALESTTILSDIQPLLDEKQSRLDPTTENNAVVQDNAGFVKDAGVPLATVEVNVVDFALPSINSSTSEAHGQTAWDSVQFYFIPKISTGGWVVDAEVPVGSSVATSDNGWTFQVDPTNIVMGIKNVNTGIQNPNGTTGKTDLISSNFSVRAKFIKFGVLTP